MGTAMFALRTLESRLWPEVLVTASSPAPLSMAPELLTGKTATIKSDLYALGLILFEIFTGKRAYEARTVGELKQLHDTGMLTTPSSIVRHGPGGGASHSPMSRKGSEKRPASH
jgi:hypothetical protein